MKSKSRTFYIEKGEIKELERLSKPSKRAKTMIMYLTNKKGYFVEPVKIKITY